MGVAEVVTERSIRGAQLRAEHEVSQLIEAAFAVLRREGSVNLTVGDVLAEAGLSTRAFYRHFTSRDELVLAVFDREQERALVRLETDMARATGPQAKLEAWIDTTLALGFDKRRAHRTQVLAVEGVRLQQGFPEQFAQSQRNMTAPLIAVLEDGLNAGVFPTAQPKSDARSLHAIVWNLVERALRGESLTREEARVHALRFCLPPLGVPVAE
jgi:AcrR family transcriptional regulator